MSNEADKINRGPRKQSRVDLATADWQRNEYGVDVLMLNTDPVSGAFTMALRTPAELDYPEREHYYICDQDLFQLEGEFHHDEERPFRQGDYVYRPPGTVYGHSPGSAGGTIIVSLNGKPQRHQFDDHPPWEGEYLVDRAWQQRETSFMLIHSEALDWQPSELGDGILSKPLRGMLGKRSAKWGARSHSPWGADAAGLLRIPQGFTGDWPAWQGFHTEVLVLAGQAETGEESWYRGCYTFDVLPPILRIQEDLDCYIRLFREL